MRKIISISITLILMICISFVSARTQPPRIPINDSSPFFELIKNYPDFEEYSDFSIDESYFYRQMNSGRTESKEVFSDLRMSSEKISNFDINYSIGIHIVINEYNQVHIYPPLTQQQIHSAINQFEAKKQISQFVSMLRYNDTHAVLSGNSTVRLNSGDYFIEYNIQEDEFTRYRLPISMSDQFPLLNSYKERVQELRNNSL